MAKLMNTPQHITEITREWFEAVSKGANLEVGQGLKKDDYEGKRKITIDETQFKLMVYAILKRTIGPGGFTYVDPSTYTLDYEN